MTLRKLLPCGQKLKSSEETTSLSLAAALGSEREKAVAGCRGHFPAVHMEALAKAGSGEEAGEETQLNTVGPPHSLVLTGVKPLRGPLLLRPCTPSTAFLGLSVCNKCLFCSQTSCKCPENPLHEVISSGSHG